MHSFIPPNVDVTDTETAEWQYFANLPKEELRARWRTSRGIEAVTAFHSTPFSGRLAAQFVGSFSGKLDLRGAPLAGLDCHGADCRDIDFYCSDLSGSDFAGANLSGSFLSEANIRGTHFDWATLDGVYLDNAEFDRTTTFNGVKLNEINFTLAILVQDLAIGQQRIAHLETRHPWFALFLRITTDYGRSFMRYSLWVVGILLLFACTYRAFPGLLGDKAQSFLDCLYFSIVTFATVGYGDIVPLSTVGKCVVCAEIGLGYVMGGLLVALLARRMLASQ